ncbi:hypothetical protein KSS87_003951 [Heliosperma pusillum]|nr:hypothetical protein KSS87_003951 [Heliosperma pusillum]
MDPLSTLQVSQLREVSPGVCSYPRSPAYGLGITSAIALLLAHIIINLIVNSTSGCICCRRNSYFSITRWILALVYFIVSWFTFVVALLSLLGGAVLNDQHGAENVVQSGYKYCYVPKPGVFAVASVLSLASVTLSILYFLITAYAEGVGSSFGDPALPNEGGVAMGQAQVPSDFP